MKLRRVSKPIRVLLWGPWVLLLSLVGIVILAVFLIMVIMAVQSILNPLGR